MSSVSTTCTPTSTVSHVFSGSICESALRCEEATDICSDSFSFSKCAMARAVSYLSPTELFVSPGSSVVKFLHVCFELLKSPFNFLQANLMQLLFLHYGQNYNFMLMKKWILVALSLLVSSIFLCHMDWHVNRNLHNQSPVGQLNLHSANLYLDEAGTTWHLQPSSKSVLHQTKSNTPSQPYPNLVPPPNLDPSSPNLKFTSPLPSGASYEAILLPSGTYLSTGKEQATYNYADPVGFWGVVKHTFLDVVPHLINGNYDTKRN